MKNAKNIIQFAKKKMCLNKSIFLNFEFLVIIIFGNIKL